MPLLPACPRTTRTEPTPARSNLRPDRNPKRTTTGSTRHPHPRRLVPSRPASTRPECIVPRYPPRPSDPWLRPACRTSAWAPIRSMTVRQRVAKDRTAWTSRTAHLRTVRFRPVPRRTVSPTFRRDPPDSHPMNRPCRKPPPRDSPSRRRPRPRSPDSPIRHPPAGPRTRFGAVRGRVRTRRGRRQWSGIPGLSRVGRTIGPADGRRIFRIRGRSHLWLRNVLAGRGAIRNRIRLGRGRVDAERCRGLFRAECAG